MMMTYRTLYRLLLTTSVALILAACGASEQGPRAVEEAAALEAAHRQAEEQAAVARAEEQRLVAEQASVAAAEQERAAAAAQAAREAAATAQREAARQAEVARAQAAAQVRAEVEAATQAQSARVTQLERQIENTSDEVQELEQVNDSLEQAVTAAEELLRALNEEQLKYASTTADGALQEPLDKERIAELEARMDALRREIESQSR